jgi:hypothetical protein
VVQHHRVGAAQRGARRLAQRAPRPEVAVAEGRQRVDGDAVEVSQQGQVLQAVVQEDQAQGGVVHQDLARAGGEVVSVTCTGVPSNAWRSITVSSTVPDPSCMTSEGRPWTCR